MPQALLPAHQSQDRRAMRGVRAAAFRPDIQGLRAVAVLAVVADHVIGRPPSGFVGVDVFFVVSGYLITGLLLREYERTGTVSFTGFYVRRIKRIVPVAVTVLFVTVCASYVLIQGRIRDVVVDAAAAGVFLSNWQFARIGTDYFQLDKPPSPLQHYWSLAVEEQFYMVWPWLLLGLLLLGVRFLRWRREHVRLVAGVAVGLITVVSFAWALQETSAVAKVAYFSTFSRAWELGLGGLVAVMAPRLRFVSRPVRAVLAWSGLGGIVAAVLLVPEGAGFPAPWALLPVAATALVIAAGEGGPIAVPVLTNRVSVYVGEISYSLYLWHWPVAVLLVSLLPRGSALYMAVALGGTVALSAASYRWLEQPTRRAGWFRWARRADGVRIRPSGLALGWYRPVGLAVAVVLVAVVADAGARAVQPAEHEVAPVVSVGRTAAEPGDCFGAAALDPAHECAGVNAGSAVTPLPRAALPDTGEAFACFMAASEALRTCDLGSEAPDAYRVALVGDSHAAQLVPALEPHLERLNWRVTTFVGWGCRWFLPGPEVRNCRDALPAIQDRVTSGEFDLILTTSRRGTTTVAADHAEVMREAVAEGIGVVVVADNPEANRDAVECVGRVWFDVADGCGTRQANAFDTPDPVAEAGRSVDGVGLVDLTRYYCVDGYCPSVVGNVVVYRDAGGHVTATWARTLGPYLLAAVQRALTPGSEEVPAALPEPGTATSALPAPLMR
ncbi:acyltransferase family protein [Promicromonospora soli]|uniref:Acyltransferase n=1 Tax=Promicromonospora soli TaxID=2035533 RepID=A0A919G240_9MICO|nr:acyltransferase family protein [Promicromonospora soli]GHH76476.1 acyltransferase [Promicromonospora soli]